MELMSNVYFSNALDWVYSQSSGRLYLADAQDVRTFVAQGYSGAPGHINRSESEHLFRLGPIPRGLWLLDAPVLAAGKLGPQTVGLEPQTKGVALGRSGFYIHGDNSAGNYTASKGCPVFNRRTRDFIAAGYWAGIRRFLVTD